MSANIIPSTAFEDLSSSEKVFLFPSLISLGSQNQNSYHYDTN